MSSDITGPIQGGRFQKGQSGNPLGKPRGARNSATLAAETLLEGEAEKLTRKCIEMALNGDTVALKICIDRIYPVRKDRAVRFGLPPINSARDAADLAAGVVEAVAAGNLTPSEAAEIGKLIEIYVRAYQIAENDRVDSIHQLSNEELMRIIRDGSRATTRLITGSR